MSRWTSKVNRGKGDGGLLIVTWDKGGPEEFTYKGHSKTTPDALRAFKAEAVAARDAELVRLQNNRAETVAAINLERTRRRKNVNLATELDELMNSET